LGGAIDNLVFKKKNLTNFTCNTEILNYKQPAERHIYERGCLRAGEDWLESHLVPVAGACVSIMVMQVLKLLK